MAEDEEIRELHEALVPVELSFEEFWCRCVCCAVLKAEVACLFDSLAVHLGQLFLPAAAERRA